MIRRLGPIESHAFRQGTVDMPPGICGVCGRSQDNPIHDDRQVDDIVTAIDEKARDLVRTISSSIGHVDPSYFASTMLVANVFLEALAVYIERNEKYHDHWKSNGWMMHLAEMNKRTGRLMHQFWGNEPYQGEGADIDDAIDLMVATAFFIIQNREGDMRGRF